MSKLYELDLKDRKILYELDKNARISFSALSKKVGLSTEVVHYRVKRFENEKIITGYQTAIDYKKLGLIHFKICLSFNGISLKNEEILYNKLKIIPQIVWIAKCQGEFDCIISCTVNSMIELNDLKNKIINLSNSYISKKEISITVDTKSFSRDYLVDQKNESFMEYKGQIKIDEFDLKILRMLLENARCQIIDISKNIGLSVKATAIRIKKLVKTGVISNFRIVINYEKLGINFYKTFFYIKNPDDEKLKMLLQTLHINKNLIHNLRVVGAWDLEPEFEFSSKEEFQKTMQELMNNFSDVIQKISVIEIIKEYKYTYFYK